MVFSKIWFQENQQKLLFLLNFRILGLIVRFYMGIYCYKEITAIQASKTTLINSV